MLINLRNALMTGKRLPYDAEVEFLESTGTQYINTGVILDSTYGIDMTFAPMEDWHVSEHGIFGASNSSRHNVLQIQTSSAGVGLWMPASTRIAAKEYSTTGILQHWQINIGNDGKVFIDGTTKGSTRPNSSSDLNQPIYLFARNLNGSLKSGSCSSMRLYSCKITDANGNAVFDPIPVRKGTVGYLYDRVSGKLFGNAGTDDFVVGQDVVPVEYIESHGTEWIDTGMYLTTDFEYDLKFRMNTPLTSGTKSLGLQYHTWGASYPMWCIGLTTFNKPRVFANMSAGGNAATGVDVGWNYDTDITMSLHGNTLTYNSTDITFARWENSETSLATMKIFAEEVSRSGGRVLDFAYARCYFLDLYSGNGDSRKFRPVRVGTEGAMMDTLTRRIYRNAGTGAFGYGNDLKYPIPSE